MDLKDFLNCYYLFVLASYTKRERERGHLVSAFCVMIVSLYDVLLHIAFLSFWVLFIMK